MSVKEALRMKKFFKEMYTAGWFYNQDQSLDEAKKLTPAKYKKLYSLINRIA